MLAIPLSYGPVKPYFKRFTGTDWQLVISKNIFAVKKASPRKCKLLNN